MCYGPVGMFRPYTLGHGPRASRTLRSHHPPASFRRFDFNPILSTTRSRSEPRGKQSNSVARWCHSGRRFNKPCRTPIHAVMVMIHVGRSPNILLSCIWTRQHGLIPVDTPWVGVWPCAWSAVEAVEVRQHQKLCLWPFQSVVDGDGEISLDTHLHLFFIGDSFQRGIGI